MRVRSFIVITGRGKRSRMQSAKEHGLAACRYLKGLAAFRLDMGSGVGDFLLEFGGAGRGEFKLKRGVGKEGQARIIAVDFNGAVGIDNPFRVASDEDALIVHGGSLVSRNGRQMHAAVYGAE